MNLSPLQIERHFFSKIVVEAHPDAVGAAAHQLQSSVEVGRAMDNPLRFQVTLVLKLEAPPNQKASYTGEIRAVGFFRVADGYGDERKCLTLVESNGAAVLFGAIRELVMNLTSRGPWPAVLLPSMHFIRPTESPKINRRLKTKTEKLARD